MNNEFLKATMTATVFLSTAFVVQAADGVAFSLGVFLQIAAFEKGGHATRDHRWPEAVPGLKLLIVDLAEAVKILVQQPPQIGSARIAWQIQR